MSCQSTKKTLKKSFKGTTEKYQKTFAFWYVNLQKYWNLHDVLIYQEILLFISAKIDSPWNLDPKTNRPITVNKIIDTNLLQYAKGPYG